MVTILLWLTSNDFTRANARRFYPTRGDVADRKGLRIPRLTVPIRGHIQSKSANINETKTLTFEILLRHIGKTQPEGFRWEWKCLVGPRISIFYGVSGFRGFWIRYTNADSERPLIL